MPRNIPLFRGGIPVVRFMWCKENYPQFEPGFTAPHIEKSPPYDAHVDGIYRSGYFTLGMPFRPHDAGMTWQEKALTQRKLEPDDIIQMIGIPEDHFVTDINFKIIESDPALAGATVALTAQVIGVDDEGNFTYQEITDVEDAVAAQGQPTTIAVDQPVNLYVSLRKVTDGYVTPLYAKPSLPAGLGGNQAVVGQPLMLGLKIVSLPTDQNVTLDMAQNGWYMSVKIQGFESPGFY